jgi:acyl-CoA thioester hydrolase
MRIVHHSNYLRFCEEARVAWAHARGLLDYQKLESAFSLAVVETRVFHHKPAVFGDVLQVEVKAKLEGVRMIFAYRITVENRAHEVVSTAKTVHAALDLNLKLIRPPEGIKNTMQKEAEINPWTETWLSNLFE